MADTQALLRVFSTATGVSTDTRTLRPGELFFALHGPHFDGNRYAAAALAAGASAAVVDDASVARDPDRYLVVEDTLAALQSLARAYRDTLDIPVFGLTGSNGKTTTKELVAGMLACRYRVSATVGNLNNHIGVPLTVLRIPRDAEVAVVEMGANHVGEIGALCEIADPTHGAITNIGRAHLEGFGGIEGVRRGKGELFDYLRAHGGHAFVDVTDAEVAAVGQRAGATLPYASAEAVGEAVGEGLLLTAALTRAYPTAEGVLTEGRYRVPYASRLPGEHNHRNIALAASVAHYYKVPLGAVAAAVAAYAPANSRSEVRAVGASSVLLDAYNANPDSTLAGLRWLASRPEANKVALLGTLAELGAYAKTAHAEVAAAARSIPGLTLGFYGETWVPEEGEARFTEVGDAAEWLAGYYQQADTAILIKGSRANRLERVLPSG